MIAIDNILVSDQVISEQFVCDLTQCKGGCCEDGDAGAPLEKEEMAVLKENFAKIKPYLTAEGLAQIEKDGLYQYTREFGWVTPTINGQLCAYGHRDRNGIIKCGIEEAYLNQEITWKKPISCHLYPIKISHSKRQDLEYVNYEPREDMCKPGCKLGKRLKVPVYVFLKEAITRKYGQSFYETLEATADHLSKESL